MIALIIPPSPPGFVSNKDTMGGFGQLYDDPTSGTLPPLDVFYVGAVLKQKQIPVKLFDSYAMAMDVDALIYELKLINPDLICIRTSTPTMEWDIKIAEQLAENIKAKIIFFGPHATLFASEMISNPIINGIVLGEPEYAIASLVQKPWTEVDGFIFKDGTQLIINEKVNLIEKLDELPFPAWDLIPINSYSLGDSLNNKEPFFTLLSSRGCPFGCKYCPYPLAQGNKWRFRSVENVLDEIQYLVDSFGMQGLLFRDPEFSADRNRVALICKGIIEKGLVFSWRCETRIDTVDNDLLRLMAKAGCVGLNFGIESVNENIVKSIGRKWIPLDYITNTIALCQQLGINTFCFFIIGLPGENSETIIDMINFALDSNPGTVQFTIYTPYFGTELRLWYEENGYIEVNQLMSLTSYNSVIRTEQLTSAELQKFAGIANRIWGMRLQERRLTSYKDTPIINKLIQLVKKMVS